MQPEYAPNASWLVRRALVASRSARAAGWRRAACDLVASRRCFLRLIRDPPTRLSDLSNARGPIRRHTVSTQQNAAAMANTTNTLSAISLFVEDLEAAKDFYVRSFQMPIVYEDENSAVVKFDNLMVNLLKVECAPEIVEPGLVAPRDAGSRFQISIWVADVDAVCSRLRLDGVEILAGPKDRPWGMRTANFVDPAGHSWEIAQQLGAS